MIFQEPMTALIQFLQRETTNRRSNSPQGYESARGKKKSLELMKLAKIPEPEEGLNNFLMSFQEA